MNDACPDCDSLAVRRIDEQKLECLSCGKIFIRQQTEEEKAA